MTIYLRHLHETGVRTAMVAELNSDVSEGTSYVGTQLSDTGQSRWLAQLGQALQEHDIDWLKQAIENPENWETHYIQHRKTGPVRAKVPSDAAFKLAMGEFLIYYCKAVCVVALSNGDTQVRVVRVRQASNPRPESVVLEGTLLDAEAILRDLRQERSVEKALGVPAGPNSGLAVELL